MASMADDERAHRPIETLPLSGRALKLLQRAGIRTVGDLVLTGRSGLMAIRGFGNASLQSVRDALARIGLKLIGD